MRKLIKVLGNVALIIGGFFIVLFGTSKLAKHNDHGDRSLQSEFDGMVHADVPAGSSDSSSSSSSSDSSGSDGAGDSSDSADA